MTVLTEATEEGKLLKMCVDYSSAAAGSQMINVTTCLVWNV